MLSSTYVNEEGYVTCCVCHRKLHLKDSLECVYCDKFVCKVCSERIRGYGIVCNQCKKKFKKHIKAVKNGLEKDGYKSGWSSF